MSNALVLLLAVVAGWLLQLVLAFRQSTDFNRCVLAMRRRGTVAVGTAGRRYRGGRAFVAVAVDGSGVIREAISLQGWTTFARERPLMALVGLTAARVSGPQELAGLTTQQREAARDATRTIREGSSAVS